MKTSFHLNVKGHRVGQRAWNCLSQQQSCFRVTLTFAVQMCLPSQGHSTDVLQKHDGLAVALRHVDLCSFTVVHMHMHMHPGPHHLVYTVFLPSSSFLVGAAATCVTQVAAVQRFILPQCCWGGDVLRAIQRKATIKAPLWNSAASFLQLKIWGAHWLFLFWATFSILNPATRVHPLHQVQSHTQECFEAVELKIHFVPTVVFIVGFVRGHKNKRWIPMGSARGAVEWKWISFISILYRHIYCRYLITN